MSSNTPLNPKSIRFIDNRQTDREIWEFLENNGTKKGIYKLWEHFNESNEDKQILLKRFDRLEETLMTKLDNLKIVTTDHSNENETDDEKQIDETEKIDTSKKFKPGKAKMFTDLME